MNASFASAAALLRLCAYAQKLTPAKATMPVLATLRLGVDDDGLTIGATNLDVSVSLRTVADSVKKEGAICADARGLCAALGAIGDEPVTLEVRSNTLLVVGNGTKARVLTMSADEYPQTPSVGGGETVTSERLIEALGVAYAASNDETRINLNGVYIAGDVAVATDGHRLAVKPYTEKSPLAGRILPTKFVQLVPGFVDVVEGEFADMCTVAAADNAVCVSTAGGTLTSRLIDGSFPDYQPIIPKRSTLKMHTVNRAALADALRVVSRMGDGSNQPMKATFADGKLVISVTNTARGDVEKTIDCKVADGGLAEAAYSIAYFAEAVSHFECTEISIGGADALSPSLIVNADVDDGALAVVMPMRL